MLSRIRCFERGRLLLAVAVAALLAGGSAAVATAAEHPFILWTEQDAAALREKVATQPWAKAAYEKLVENPDPHEPFKAGRPQVSEFRRIAQNEHGLAVAVVGRSGSGVNDRVMLRYGDHADEPITLAGDGESFRFADYLYVRIGKETVEASGGLRAMKVRVSGRPKLVVNGEARDATVAEGLLTFAE